MDTSSQEALWVLRAQCADREALELLLRSVQPALHRYLHGLLGPPDGDDVLQEVLLLVFRNLIWLERPELFRPWAFRIASRAAVRHLKKRRRWLDHTSDDAALAAAPAPPASPPDELVRELARMDGISAASRAVLVLHFQEQMSLPEVAAILEIPLGTVKSRLAHGLTTLRKLLGSERRP